jgi:uncharacterized protein
MPSDEKATTPTQPNLILPDVQETSDAREKPTPAEADPAPHKTEQLSPEEWLIPAKTIRIAVSGDVHLTCLEKEIIDTKDFQRLRGVRQLGTVNLVYPTALHTRFDHSIGTLSMAARIARSIKENRHSLPDEREISETHEVLIRLYALLHDVPHVPFGHTIEDELGIYTRHDKNPDRFKRFFGQTSDIGSLLIKRLGMPIYLRFAAIYRWNGKTPSEETQEDLEKQSEWYRAEKTSIFQSITENDDAFVYDIVSNTVCADLLDYLARDSYFCNLDIALEYRFLTFLYLDRTGKENLRRVFVRLWKPTKPRPRPDTLTDLCRLLETRYLVAERAYFHHAKIISGAMLGRALQESKIPEAELYTHSDDSVLRKLSESMNPIANRLANQLIERKLYTGPIEFKYSRLSFSAIQDRDYAHDPIDKKLKELGTSTKRKWAEDDLADKIGAAPGDVLIYAPQDEGMNLKAADMKVLWKEKHLPLSKIDDPITQPRLEKILDAHRRLWAIQVMYRSDLEPEKIRLLRQACKIEFECGSDEERMQEMQEFYEKAISQAVIKIPVNIIGSDTSARDYQRLLTQAAKEMAAQTDDKRPFSQRVKAATKKHFGN